jgi:hypothetical protein
MKGYRGGDVLRNAIFRDKPEQNAIDFDGLDS